MQPLAREAAIIQAKTYRFTVLTERLIRLEYSEIGQFEDRATQTVINRDFPVPKYRIYDTDDQLEIITEHIHLTYDKKRFSENGLSIQIRGNISAYRSIWSFGQELDTLKGTARTLDEADGVIDLEHGLLSRNGFSIIDDSKALAIEEDGWVAPREKNNFDIYFFGYGRAYLECLKDFYRLCGETPMLPRYALGNWWSRFHRYTDSSYRELINRFKEEAIPFSVAVIDMDWHLTEINPKYGSGWTGYTWNKKLFPNPKYFLEWLHEEGLHVTLNVHPADGVRAHEEMYVEFAKELSLSYENEDKIHFDISSPEFLQAYFKLLHHPSEAIGVDFWWVDWQQGGSSKIEGLDPLWMLNHFHYLDNKRRGKRGLILSRYAGIGSHRYPIGFSGDSITTWETLDFQPYFTATASNVGYGWWSHDIGGHMHGIRNDEMAARWMQFGVFSPIMRIHSSDNPFNVKEPWNYNQIVEQTMKTFLRLRHQLIPYLYTMNRRFNQEGEPLIQPMYYRNSEAKEAYEVPNEYYFGTELIVCPITKPMDPKLNLACFKAWLPEGIYIDFFTGRVYRGDRKIDLYRDISSIPVLAKAGAIVPMAAGASIKNRTDNPMDMEIRVFAGANGEFKLYEDNSDDSTEENLQVVETNMKFKWGSQCEFTINRCVGNAEIIPTQRNYVLRFVGFEEAANITIACNGVNVSYEREYHKESHSIILKMYSIDTQSTVLVKVDVVEKIIGNDIEAQVFELLNKSQIEFNLKDTIFQVIKKYEDNVLKLAGLQVLGLEENLLGALFEVITAY